MQLLDGNADLQLRGRGVPSELYCIPLEYSGSLGKGGPHFLIPLTSNGKGSDERF